MNETSQTPSCSRCGAALAPKALKGLCPRCLMELNLVAPTEIPGEIGPHGTKVTKLPPTPEEIGKHFPQFEILECLGRGGMGVVYKARQPKLNRIVALKILAPEKVAEPKFAERFQREAEALARLNHPNIVTVYDFGETDGLYYLTMEFADGVSLRRLLQTRRIAPAEALAIVPKICEALQFAHDEGVVHRDIKPENILLDKKGRVKIADFGIAKIMGGTPLSPSDGERMTARTSEDPLTQDQVVGTPNYMAPEQVEHPQTVDHRADIYSLGVVFYEMLTGELPLGKFQPPSRKVQVDVRLDEVVLHALAKEPELRYQQASQVKSDVETIVGLAPPKGGSPVAPPPMMPSGDRRGGKRHKITLIAGGAMVLVLGLGAVVVALRPSARKASLRLPGLVSRWPGEYSTADVAGGNDGKVAGYGTVAYGPGVVGPAFVFDGIHRDRVDVGNPANLRLQDFTIDAWIKRSSPTKASLDDNNQDGAVAGEGGIVFGYGRGGYGFGLLGDGRLLLSRIDMDGIYSTNAVSDTRWHHVAVTKTGSTAVFYIDGNPASGPISYTTTYDFDTSAAIGSRGDARGGTFFGMTDEPSVYSRALASSEIRAIYSAGQNGKRKPSHAPFAVTAPRDEAAGLVGMRAAEEAVAFWQAPQAGPAEAVVDLGGGVKLEFVLIRPGSFMMGSSDRSVPEYADEKPAHRERFAAPFYLGKYEVTQEQWDAVMESNPSHFKGAKLPVEDVSWEEANMFVRRLREKTGRTFALPTEAQWEYACRAGTITRYCFGDNDANLGDYAWFKDNSDGVTHPVGQKKPNRWGLYDMHGNVWEWCADAFGPYRGNSVVPPQGPPAGDLHVIRGGAWTTPPNGLRSSNRNSDWISFQHVGLRCVMLVEGTTAATGSRILEDSGRQR